MSDDHPMPAVNRGDVLGYAVLCWNEEPGEWAADWDGKVYDATAVEAALADCRDADFPVTVVALVATRRESPS